MFMSVLKICYELCPYLVVGNLFAGGAECGVEYLQLARQHGVCQDTPLRRVGCLHLVARLEQTRGGRGKGGSL